MKKIFTISLMLLMIAWFSVCHALSANHMNAGGVYIGQSRTEVVSIYGKPSSSSSQQITAGARHTETKYEYGKFGTTFTILFEGDRVGLVTVSGNNGIATSDGIKVGTHVSEVKRILGPGREFKDGKHRIIYEQDDTPAGYLPQTMTFYFENNKVSMFRIWNGQG